MSMVRITSQEPPPTQVLILSVKLKHFFLLHHSYTEQYRITAWQVINFYKLSLVSDTKLTAVEIEKGDGNGGQHGSLLFTAYSAQCS